MGNLANDMKQSLKTPEDYEAWASSLELQVLAIKADIAIALQAGLISKNPDLQNFLESTTGIAEAAFNRSPKQTSACSGDLLH